jgi:hypothetical protein
MGRGLRERICLLQVAVVVVAVLSLGVGFCLFDDDGPGTDQHAVARDLCSGLLVSSSLTVTLLALAVLDRVQVDSLRPICVVSLRPIDPPPKPLQFS